MTNESHPTVYSSELGRICPKCGKPVAGCTCKKENPRPKGDGVMRIYRDSKGRKGKTMTVITGGVLSDQQFRELLSDLKRICGSGGSFKDGVLEIQGDHREKILEELKKRGIRAKIAGG